MNKKPLISFIILLVMATLATGWWAYRRYLSPAINPSMEIYPVRGIDISSHNGMIDFEKVKQDGYDFVMIKATEGISFRDSSFYRNYNSARKAGLRVGAYHFFRFDCDGRLQAYNFLTAIDNLQLDFPPVLDVEDSGNPPATSRDDVIDRLTDAIHHAELHGHIPMIYTNKGGYAKYIEGHFDDYPLWICSFTDPPGPERWDMWQYTHRGNVDGIEGKVDLNIDSSTKNVNRQPESSFIDTPID